MANPNGRLSRRLLEAMGLWNQALATGAVFVNPYDAANIADARRNLADSLSLEFTYTSRLGDLLEPAFASSLPSLPPPLFFPPLLPPSSPSLPPFVPIFALIWLGHFRYLNLTTSPPTPANEI